MKAFPDRGDRATIATVKDHVVEAVTAYKMTMALPDDLDLRAKVLADENRLEERRISLSRAFVAAKVPEVDYKVAASLNAVRDDASYRAFMGYELVVERWSGVKVQGSEAFVLFDGRNRYELAPGQWYEPDTVQWHGTLRLEGGRWKIVRQATRLYRAP